MMREVRRVSPGRQPTENELCDSQAAAIMTSVSRVINEVNFCVDLINDVSVRIKKKEC